MVDIIVGIVGFTLVTMSVSMIFLGSILLVAGMITGLTAIAYAVCAGVMAGISAMLFL